MEAQEETRNALETGKDTSEQRRVLPWVVLALVLGAATILLPLRLSLIMAAWTAALTRPLVERMSRALGGRTRGSALVVMLLLLLLLLPVVAALLSLSFGAVDFVHKIFSAGGSKNALSKLVMEHPDIKAHLDLDSAIRMAQQYGSRVWGILRAVAGATAGGLIGLFIFFLGAHTLLVDGQRAWTWIETRSPISPRHLGRLADAFHETGRGLLVGVGLTGLTQGAVATIAYLSLGIPSALVLGLLTALTSLIPSIGTALVWVPVAAGLAITGRWVAALVLVGIGVFVIGLIDNLVRPLFARFGKLNLPTFLLFLAIFGGLAMVGAEGIILGPLLLRLALEAIEIAREEGLVGPRTPLF